MSEEYELPKHSLKVAALMLVGISVMCATVSESFHYVRYDEYALKQDKYGTVDLGHVYTEGRYFLTLNYDLITFPAYNLPVDLAVVVFTETGLEFSVEVLFYYTLPKENIGDIYNSFSKSYNDLVRSNAKTTIKNAATKYRLEDYFTNRSEIQSYFADRVSAVLSDIVMVYVPKDLFRIIQVKLPDSVISRSLDSEIALQKNELLANSQQVAVIRAETSRIVASIDAQTVQTLEFARNSANRLIARSESYANQVEIRARADGIAILFEHIGTVDNSTLNTKIIKSLALLDNSANTTFVGSNNFQTQIQAP